MTATGWHRTLRRGSRSDPSEVRLASYGQDGPRYSFTLNRDGPDGLERLTIGFTEAEWRDLDAKVRHFFPVTP